MMVLDDLADDLSVIHGHDVDFLFLKKFFDDHSNDGLAFWVVDSLFCLLMMNDAVDLLVLVDVELYAVDESAEGVHDVGDAVCLAIDLLWLGNVDDNTDDVLVDPN